jgi:hypothetical protein
LITANEILVDLEVGGPDVEVAIFDEFLKILKSALVGLVNK